jgi:hypothetical protein
MLLKSFDQPAVFLEQVRRPEVVRLAYLAIAERGGPFARER